MPVPGQQLEFTSCERTGRNGLLQRRRVLLVDPVLDGLRGLEVCPDVPHPGLVEGDVGLADGVEVAGEVGLVFPLLGDVDGGWECGGGAVDFG